MRETSKLFSILIPAHPLRTLFILIVIGLIFSTFYGFLAGRIFCVKNEIEEKEKLYSWRFHQFCLNFVCSFVGWLALIYLMIQIKNKWTNFTFGYGEIFISLIALSGITGLLPSILSRSNFQK